MEPNYGYKHTRGFVVLLIIIFCGWVIVAHSQESVTPNLNNNSWGNAYNVSNLTCWQGGDPGCSPGGQPYVRPNTGDINFSYNIWDIYQYRNIADVLPKSGAGLVVTGWNFQYTAKVGNGWDNGAYDYLRSYVNVIGAGNKLIEQVNYVHTVTHDWATFNLSRTYDPATARYTTDNLKRIGFGFIGVDNNYWVGPYGPEVNQVSFTVRYQPDPCVVNPLSSPSCPGFMKAIAPPAIPGTELVTPSSVISATNNNSTPSLNLAIAVVKLNAQKEQAIVETAVEQSSAGGEIRQNVATTSTISAPNSTAIKTANVRNLDSTGQVQEQEQSIITMTNTSEITVSTVAVPQPTRPVQSRDTSARSDTTTDNTQIDQLAIPPAAASQTITTAATMVQPVQNRGSSMIQTETNETANQFSILSTRSPETAVSVANDSTTSYSLVEPARPTLDTPGITLAAPVAAPMIGAPMEPTIVSEPPRAIVLDTAPVENSSNTIANALIDRTNPLNDAMTQRPLAPAAATQGPAVRSNTADNDVAGGVTIDQIARVPVGFDAYQTLSLREIAFYQPREIYRGQRTVDNVRALRSLGQDARHQEMVDQQYRR